ncbi:hypothetical protein [Bradyrhizobium japonicum]|uniref:hypothetical protein n=1 Tax=Bradyrhizobium japonicum TaxID=375 RepID=UPI001BA9174C|nr:hypothetical protein [Bradyrhizobium japonicum]MBR0958369.1 hypothetical protein [Bradyrhizobium japonicum]
MISSYWPNSADLYLSDDFRLLLGATNLGVVFACKTGETCRPLSWSSDGSFVAVGRILPVSTTLKGGYISFPGQNQLQLESGELQTADLQLDSREKVTPIVGNIQKLELKLASQNWQVDQNVRIGAASLRLTSQNMAVVDDDKYPIGKLKVEGNISEVTANGIGRVILAAGQTQFTIEASRKSKDDLKIDSGSIVGKLNVRSDDHLTEALATFSMEQLLYYRGVGSAKFSFHIENASSHVITPSDHSEQGFPGGRTVVDVHSRDIALKLSSRFGFADADVKVNNGAWSISEQKDIPITVAASVDTGEIVYLNVQTGGGDLNVPYKTVCGPHVNINRGDYVFRAKSDLTLSDKSRRFSIRNVTIEPDFDADVDDRNCGLIVEGICGIVGGLITGGVGAIGAAIACGKEVAKKKKEMHEKMRSLASEKVGSLKLDLSF